MFMFYVIISDTVVFLFHCYYYNSPFQIKCLLLVLDFVKYVSHQKMHFLMMRLIVQNLIFLIPLKIQQNSFIIPVTLNTGVRDPWLVCVCLEGVVSIDANRRLSAGDRVTDRWRPAPPETCQTLELVWDLREEALHTTKQTETCTEADVKSVQSLPAVMTKTRHHRGRK